MSIMPTVILYGRDGCHLCDEARASILALHAEQPSSFRLREVDITSDSQLEARLRERIPVVTLGDEELFDFQVDEEALERRLAEAAPAL